MNCILGYSQCLTFLTHGYGYLFSGQEGSDIESEPMKCA